ncbi:MAG: aspartate/glutamate racemase family protein [Pseudomonadota bacterium]
MRATAWSEMRVLVFNPNSTVSMTDGIVAAARGAAAEDMEIVGETNHDAPPAIQGEEDGRAALPGVVTAAEGAAAAGFDAVVLACFDDIGLEEARAATPLPVVGVGEAAYHGAMLAGGQFSVITTLPVSVPVLEANIARYGFASRCARVRASGLPVLTLEDEPERAARVLAAEAEAAAREDGARALVLGCAGMAAFGPTMSAASGLPAVDGVAAAIGLARMLVTASSRPSVDQNVTGSPAPLRSVMSP